MQIAVDNVITPDLPSHEDLEAIASSILLAHLAAVGMGVQPQLWFTQPVLLGAVFEVAEALFAPALVGIAPIEHDACQFG